MAPDTLSARAINYVSITLAMIGFASCSPVKDCEPGGAPDGGVRIAILKDDTTVMLGGQRRAGRVMPLISIPKQAMMPWRDLLSRSVWGTEWSGQFFVKSVEGRVVTRNGSYLLAMGEEKGGAQGTFRISMWPEGKGARSSAVHIVVSLAEGRSLLKSWQEYLPK